MVDYAAGAAGYPRLFWLLPFPILLALFAIGLLSALREPWRSFGVLVVPAVMLLIGGNFVWSAGNIYSEDVLHVAPYVAANPYKMPSGLLEIAEHLRAAETGPERRILCSVRSASHLSPFGPAFDFVYARDYQTDVALAMAGRTAEAEQRGRLSRDFMSGAVKGREAKALLQHQRVGWVVLDEPLAPVEEELRTAGYREVRRADAYRLWERGSSRGPSLEAFCD